MIIISSFNCFIPQYLNIQENLKQKDQAIRKYEQEIDSLQFRNDQVGVSRLDIIVIYKVATLVQKSVSL